MIYVYIYIYTLMLICLHTYRFGTLVLLFRPKPALLSLDDALETSCVQREGPVGPLLHMGVI